MNNTKDKIDDILDILMNTERVVFNPSVTIRDMKIASVEYKKGHIEALTDKGFEYLDEVFADDGESVWTLWDCIKTANT